MKKWYVKIISLFFLIILFMQFNTIMYAYENHCWKCKNHISSSKDTRCDICGWYICSKCGACMYGCERLTSNHIMDSDSDHNDFPVVIVIILTLLFLYFLYLHFSKKEKDRKDKEYETGRNRGKIEYEEIRIQEDEYWKEKKRMEERKDRIKEVKTTQYHNKIKSNQDRQHLIEHLKLGLEDENKNREEIKMYIKYVLEQEKYTLNQEIIGLLIQYYKINPLDEIEQLLKRNNYEKQINAYNNVVWVKYK